MKALSLWQPWASLIAIGAKQIETRCWPPPPALIGERVAIHAGKCKDWLWQAEEDTFLRALKQGYDQGRLALVDNELPLGALVCTAVLREAVVMTPDWIAELRDRNPDEHAFGLYQPDRHAWLWEDIQPLPEPVPLRGRQRVFNLPAGVLSAAA
jgi:hypothetical protein